MAVGGACALAVTAGAATVAATGMPLLAASPQPSASPKPAAGQCDRFVANFAASIGKSQDQVRKAYSDALAKTLDDAVKAGELTQQQADAIKTRASADQLCRGALAQAVKQNGARKPGAKDLARVGIAQYAKVLGTSETDLQQQLRSGKTVKELAAAKGMDEKAFRQKLIEVVKPELDKQKQAGSVTQQQVDAVLKRLESGPLPLWDKPLTRPAKPTPTASASPSPSSSP